MQLEILKYPDPRLKEISKPVEEFGPKLHKLLDDMAETMYAANGVGLAAPQVAETIRAFVVDVEIEEGAPRKLMELVNPRFTQGEGKIVYEEGCLSVPGVTEEVTRKGKVKVEYQDRFGVKQELIAEGLLAVALQHENDHLDGILFVERLSPIRRRLTRKKMEKAMAL